MPSDAVREGDWVRFQRNGELVIGVVAYIRNRDTYPRWEKQAITDNGTVDVSAILEVRGTAGDLTGGRDA